MDRDNANYLIQQARKGRMSVAEVRESFRQAGYTPSQGQDRSLLDAEANELLKSAA